MQLSNNILGVVLVLAIAGTVVGLLRLPFIRNQVRKLAYRMTSPLRTQSLRKAIADADADKQKTKRKNIVVFNSDTQQFETVQKKQLKQAVKSKAIKSLDWDRVKRIEKKALYATQ